MSAAFSEQHLIDQIRAGDSQAWQELIDRFEGRLLAFINSRLRNRAASEDVVQETFMGFLVSLPNYDDRTPLESYLFSIAAHKLTDQMRREGRRPTIPLLLHDEDAGPEPAGKVRPASSMARSRERRVAEHNILGQCLMELIASWRERGEYERLKCIELLFVGGLANKHVAARLGISEQAVANHKHFVVSKLKDAAANARLQNFDSADFGLAEIPNHETQGGVNHE
jgi:RNA polymerase sigma-70 factor (ECF subfamily)